MAWHVAGSAWIGVEKPCSTEFGCRVDDPDVGEPVSAQFDCRGYPAKTGAYNKSAHRLLAVHARKVTRAARPQTLRITLADRAQRPILIVTDNFK